MDDPVVGAYATVATNSAVICTRIHSSRRAPWNGLAYSALTVIDGSAFASCRPHNRYRWSLHLLREIDKAGPLYQEVYCDTDTEETQHPNVRVQLAQFLCSHMHFVPPHFRRLNLFAHLSCITAFRVTLSSSFKSVKELPKKINSFVIDCKATHY